MRRGRSRTTRADAEEGRARRGRRPETARAQGRTPKESGTGRPAGCRVEETAQAATARGRERAGGDELAGEGVGCGRAYARRRVKDETGVYKNLLQEISQRVGAPLPSYCTYRSGAGHYPIFTCTVELAGVTFTGEPAKSKKQAEKNAAMAAWSSLKKLVQQTAASSSAPESAHNDEQEQITIARALIGYRMKEKMAMANNPNAASPFPKKFPIEPDRKLASAQPSMPTGSKLLPFIRPGSALRMRPTSLATSNLDGAQSSPTTFLQSENRNTNNAGIWPQKFPTAGAPPYVPIRHQHHQRVSSLPYNGIGMAPPVTIRTAVPVFSAPSPAVQPSTGRQLPSQVVGPPLRCMAPPVHIRQAVPVFAAPVQFSAPQFQARENNHPLRQGQPQQQHREQQMKIVDEQVPPTPGPIPIPATSKESTEAQNTDTVLVVSKELPTAPAGDASQVDSTESSTPCIVVVSPAAEVVVQVPAAEPTTMVEETTPPPTIEEFMVLKSLEVLDIKSGGGIDA